LKKIALNISSSHAIGGTSIYHGAKLKNTFHFRKCVVTESQDEEDLEWKFKTDCGGWASHSGSGYVNDHGVLIGVHVGSKNFEDGSYTRTIENEKEVWRGVKVHCIARNIYEKLLRKCMDNLEGKVKNIIEFNNTIKELILKNNEKECMKMIKEEKKKEEEGRCEEAKLKDIIDECGESLYKEEEISRVEKK
jgi:hypothetical protein